MTSKTMPNPADQTLAAAIKAHQSGQRPQAEKLYRDYLLLKPADPQAHYLLGAVLCEVKAFDAARQSLEKALTLRTGHIPTHAMLGVVYSALGFDRKSGR